MTDEAPRPKRPLEITAGAEPIALGSILCTIVEPHRGHEVAYHRWYERDHFYSGCMVGPYNFAGRRFVATWDLKQLRESDAAAITGEQYRGSYLALYWVLDGYHDIWNRWAVRQVNALHAAGRMFQERDHVHTLLYNYEFEYRREPDGVPVELALDHPFDGLVTSWIDCAEGVERDRLINWLTTEHFAQLLADTPVGLVAGFSPLPLLIDAPGDVPRQQAEDSRLLLVWFFDDAPAESFSAVLSAHRQGVTASGLGTVVTAIPFVPTIPGTDKYTDELWGD